MDYIREIIPGREQFELVNLALPLWLAKYHFWLIILGAGGFTRYNAFEVSLGIEKKKSITIAKAISATGFIVFTFGVVGWVTFPVYQYLLSKTYRGGKCLWRYQRQLWCATIYPKGIGKGQGDYIVLPIT